MKTKKILAMLSAIVIAATSVATSAVFAKAEPTDISSTATLSSNGNVFWALANATDGSTGTIAGIYDYKDGDYIQADFGGVKLIEKVTIANSTWWGFEGTGKVKSIQLSNDPNFASYVEMECYERVGGDSDHFDKVDFRSNWSYSGKTPYRYLRIYATPAAAGFTNYGSDVTPSFAFQELQVFAGEHKEVSLVDISNTATLSSNGNVYWALTNATDGSSGTYAGIYDYKDGDYIQADLGTTKIVEKVTVLNSTWWGFEGTGKAKVIQLSNDPNFGTYEEMVCYERVGGDSDHFDRVDCYSNWLYYGRVPYRYLRIYATPAAAGFTNYGSDATPSFALQELQVYAEDESLWANVKSSAGLSSNGNEYWPLAGAIDGNYDNTAGLYGATEDSYIQADLGRPQEIKTIKVQNSNWWGWYGTGKVKTILVSNDPTFATYEEMVCYGRISGDSSHPQDADCVSQWVYTGDETYRYIRLYSIPGPAAHTNYGSDQTPCFAINELDINVIETPLPEEPDEPVEPEEPVEEIVITEVNMGDYAGKAWDVTLNAFDSTKTYTANFADGEETKSGAIGFENVETEGSVAFAIFLHTSRANVAMNIVAE